MEYISSKKFIPKLKTKNYMIGSFDVFLEQSKALMGKNINAKEFLSSKTEEFLLSILPTAYRASIVKSTDESYVGYISVFDIVYEDSVASIIFETEEILDKEDLDEIVASYKEFLYNDLGIENIKSLYITNAGKEITEFSYVNKEIPKLDSIYYSKRNRRK